MLLVVPVGEGMILKKLGIKPSVASSLALAYTKTLGDADAAAPDLDHILFHSATSLLLLYKTLFSPPNEGNVLPSEVISAHANPDGELLSLLR